MKRQAEEIEARIDALDEERRKLGAALQETRQRMEVLRQVALGGTADEAARAVLSGARLRQEAARVMAERVGVRIPIHYRDWYDLVIGEGFLVMSKRPLSAFLTGASRSPVIEKGAESGTYLLEPRLIDPIRVELAELRSELADAESVISRERSPSDRLRQHVVNLKASIRRLERQLAEGELAIEHARRAVARSNAA